MAVEKFGASERFACKVIGQNRSAFRKKKPDASFEEAQLRAALRAVAGKHPAWGWRKARWHLLDQPEWHGVALNRKRVRRLWRDEGLVCKPRARKKRRTGPGAGEQKRLTAEYPMHVISFDFQSDVTSCGRHIRFFNVIDEYTRNALAIIPRRSFKAADVVAVLENIIAETGTAPAYVRCDNGPEFTAAALIEWCNTAGVDTAFIDPGSPWQNGFIESFNAQFRRESYLQSGTAPRIPGRHDAASLLGNLDARKHISYRIDAGLLTGAHPLRRSGPDRGCKQCFRSHETAEGRSPVVSAPLSRLHDQLSCSPPTRNSALSGRMDRGDSRFSPPHQRG
jgi:putative transposase